MQRLGLIDLEMILVAVQHFLLKFLHQEQRQLQDTKAQTIYAVLQQVKQAQQFIL